MSFNTPLYLGARAMTRLDIGGQAVGPRLVSAFEDKTTLRLIVSNVLPGYWILLLALLLAFFLALLLAFLFGH